MAAAIGSETEVGGFDASLIVAKKSEPTSETKCHTEI